MPTHSVMNVDATVTVTVWSTVMTDATTNATTATCTMDVSPNTGTTGTPHAPSTARRHVLMAARWCAALLPVSAEAVTFQDGKVA